VSAVLPNLLSAGGVAAEPAGSEGWRIAPMGKQPL